MEYDKILSEDNESEKLSKFVTREYVRVNSLLNTYNENKSIRFKTPMLRSNLCDYSDAYILVKGTITDSGNNLRDRQNRPLILKNNAPFISSITRIIINNTNNAGTKDIELAIPLKYLGNFWRALNIPLISCEVSLELKWDKNCVITSLEQRVIEGADPPARDNEPTGVTLEITKCILYVPVVTLSKDGEIKLLTNLKSAFKREIIWNKYRSQMTAGAANNNLNILVDPAFTNVNRFFVLAYGADNNNYSRQSSFEFYLPKI